MFPALGFGIDYSERYRCLPYIGVPTDEAIVRVGAAAEAAKAERQRRQELSEL